MLDDKLAIILAVLAPGGAAAVGIRLLFDSKATRAAVDTLSADARDVSNRLTQLEASGAAAAEWRAEERERLTKLGDDTTEIHVKVGRMDERLQTVEARTKVLDTARVGGKRVYDPA